MFFFIHYLLRYRGKWACIGRQDSPGKSIRSKTLMRINTICGVFMRAPSPTVDAMRRRKSVAHFDVGWVFLFFERLMYILIHYRNVLCLLNCKLLFRPAIVILLGCCEFNLNVSVWESRLLTNRHTTCCRGVIGDFGQREVGMLRAVSSNRKKNEGGISNLSMMRYIANTISISVG